jgi:PAS domain S-box-containing protein
MSGSTLTASTAATPTAPNKAGGPDRRLRVLYTGSDERVWSLLEQIPFLSPEQVATASDGSCPVRGPDQKLQCDAVIIDQPAGSANPLSVLKSIKAQASHLPVVVLAPADAADLETAALDLGAETMSKSGIYRRRLVATLKQLHQRFDMAAQHQALAAREARLRQIVETLPQGVGVISRSFSVLAANAVALELLGASKPSDVVGRDFTTFVSPDRRPEVSSALERMGQGEQTTVRCDLVDSRHSRRAVEISGVMLGRDASGARGILIVFREPADVAASNVQIEALTGKLEDAERRCRDLEAELEETRTSGAATTRALETKLVDRLARLDDVEAELTRRTEADAALAATLDRERREWDEARDRLEAAHQASAAELAELRRAGADLDQARAAWTSRERELVTQVDALREEIESLRRAADDQSAELTRRTDAEAAFAATLDRERREWDEARERLEAAQQASEAELAELRRTGADLDQARAAWTARERDLVTQIEALREEIEALRRAAGEHSSLLAERGRDVETLRAEIAQLAEQRAVEQSAWEALQRDLEERAEQAEGVRSELETALNTLRADVEGGQRERAAEHDRLIAERDRLAAERGRLLAEQDRLSRDLAQAHAAASQRQDSPLVGYARMTRDGRVIDCNETLARLLGYDGAETALASLRTAGLPGLPTSLPELGPGESIRRTQARNATLPRVDGKMVRVREVATVVAGSDGDEVIERTIVDTSGAFRLEDELRQARRLEEVGTLAASMAPDIESQLRQVADAGAELRGSIPADDPRRGRVDALVRRTEDAVSLLRQLAAFSLRQTRPLETIDLNEAIRNAEPTLRRLAGTHAEFSVELGPAASIMQTEGDLEQLLTALVVNARDVLPMGGRLTVQTDLVEADAPRLRAQADEPAGVQAVVAVVAHGYRTQRAHAAPSVEMLARRCGGFLSVTNDTDRRTSFRVHFPGSTPESGRA